MNFKNRCVSIVGLIGAATVLCGGRAVPASYGNSFTADPTTFTCGYYGSIELCGGYTLISPIFLNAGDSATETINYTQPLDLPGSRVYNVAYISMFDPRVVTGPSLAGSNIAITQSTISNFSGPKLYPFTGPYEAGNLGAYIAVAGYGSGYGVPNSGFSLTGMTSQLDIVSSDPYPIIGVGYGFQAVLPATPKVLSGLSGGSLGSPTTLPAGLVGGLSSDISGPAADSQFYSFTWNGGLFQTRGTVLGANPLADFDFQLFRGAGASLTELQDLQLSSTDGFSNLMSLNLAPGDYEIGMFTDSPYDPQFTITFNTPVGSYVPEPATWVLLVGGFLTLGGALRTLRRAEAARA
ncbi:MAG TPA: hypothetical protein VGG92_19080 [Caulobacteraceae bacterium]|jgi:hypothetical protein